MLLCVLVLAAVLPIKAQMQAIFGYSTFYVADADRPYVETYLQFDAWTMQFVERTPGVFSATVEVTLVVRQGDSAKSNGCIARRAGLQLPRCAKV